HSEPGLLVLQVADWLCGCGHHQRATGRRDVLAAPDELLNSVLERLGTAGGGLPILVMDDGRLGGIITAHDIDRSRRRYRGPSAHREHPA
ncbi:hypothetical protein AB0K74_43775, partial [Streptomyces sp. NPDC056159]